MPDAPFDRGSPEPLEGLRAQWVLHVDLDQFLAAVEILRRPELAGRPLIVGGRGDQWVIDVLVYGDGADDQQPLLFIANHYFPAGCCQTKLPQ